MFENGGAGGEGGTLLPSDLGSRLVLWLDAGHGVALADGTPMSSWPDQSGNNNDAVQSTSTSRPIFVRSGTNGLPAVKFDGNLTFFEIADNASLRFGTGPFAVFAVVRGAPAVGANSMIFQKTNAPDPFAGPQLFVNPSYPTQTSKAGIQLDGNTYSFSPEGVADTTPRLFTGRRYEAATGTVLELRENGNVSSQLAVTTAINVDAPGRDAIIGHNGYNPTPGFQAYEGQISEICVVKGTLSAQELTGVEGHLLDKYGLR